METVTWVEKPDAIRMVSISAAPATNTDAPPPNPASVVTPPPGSAFPRPPERRSFDDDYLVATLDKQDLREGGALEAIEQLQAQLRIREQFASKHDRRLERDAAAKRGVRALGIEYNPDMVALAKRAAQKIPFPGAQAKVAAFMRTNRKRIQQRERLREYPNLDADDFDVIVRNGSVTLSGRVGTDAEVQVATAVLDDVLGLDDDVGPPAPVRVRHQAVGDHQIRAHASAPADAAADAARCREARCASSGAERPRRGLAGGQA